MHDWSNEKCIKILQKCKKAIPSKEEGWKVIIIDMVVKANNDIYSTSIRYGDDESYQWWKGEKRKGKAIIYNFNVSNLE